MRLKRYSLSIFFFVFVDFSFKNKPLLQLLIIKKFVGKHEMLLKLYINESGRWENNRFIHQKNQRDIRSFVYV